MPTFKFIEGVSVAGALIIEENEVPSGLRITVDETIAIANNVPVTLAVDVSQVRGVYIVCDQDVLLETNSSSSPTNTLTLEAGVPYIWFTNKPYSLWMTSDVTALFVTNASAAAAHLQMELLIDPTV
jgi:hypothetical protein